MDENKNHINNRLGEQLPSHSPDPGTWQRLSGKLDMLNAEKAYQDRLQDLPFHSPDKGTWNIISSRLNRIAYYKTGLRIALSAAAGLLLFFMVSGILDYNKTKENTIPQVASQEKFSNAPITVNKAIIAKQQNTIIQETNKNIGKTAPGTSVFASPIAAGKPVKPAGDSEKTFSANSTADDSKAIQNLTIAEDEFEIARIANSGNQEIAKIEIPVPSENKSVQVAQGNSIQYGTPTIKETIKTEVETKSVLFEKEPYAVNTPPPSIYNAPKELTTAKQANHFALAMGYLPENINNGTDNSLFHNVDLTASYNKEKVRYNTSVGMAYNEEQLEFNVSYDINTPVTAMGSGGQLDTLSYNTANMDSEYLGTEKHKYFTYNLGLGRRLFSSGKFSTWISAGAGFGIKFQDPDLISSTANSIKGQYNARNVSVNSSKPVYNDVNINFMTGIDFNYKILSKLSISFAPVSRWYFKPVLSKNNEATDELTLGFRTGLKFEF